MSKNTERPEDDKPKGETLRLNFGRRTANFSEEACAQKQADKPVSKKLPPRPGRAPVGTAVPESQVLNPQQRSKP